MIKKDDLCMQQQFSVIVSLLINKLTKHVSIDRYSKLWESHFSYKTNLLGITLNAELFGRLITKSGLFS